jgi:hypothetical protein
MSLRSSDHASRISDHERHSTSLKRILKCGVLLFALLLPSTLRAHAPSDTFLHFTLTSTNLTGHWEIKLRDLQHALGLDDRDAAAIPPQQLRAREEALALDTLGGLDVKLDGKSVPLEITDEQLVAKRDGEALLFNFKSPNWEQPPSEVEVHAEILFALDQQLRCVLRLEYWGPPQQTILNADRPVLKLSLRAPPSRTEQLLAFVREGIWHIWIGYDHILFLISLLLPAVLVWKRNSSSESSVGSASPRDEGRFRWTGASALKPAIINVLKIVTAFTIAHSITLALAALQVIELPTRWIESAIAASVIAAALNNLWPVVRERSWIVAFVFGLIHGFGFANVLAEAGLTKGSLTMALIGFNVGVEIGQLAIVVVLVPLAYRFRHTTAYTQIILRGGSIVVIAVAATWLVERVLDFKLLPF